MTATPLLPYLSQKNRICLFNSYILLLPSIRDEWVAFCKIHKFKSFTYYFAEEKEEFQQNLCNFAE